MLERPARDKHSSLLLITAVKSFITSTPGGWVQVLGPRGSRDAGRRGQNCDERPENLRPI
jgi:hypothetical protein